MINSCHESRCRFSAASNIRLKPFFDFFLRTTDKLEFNVKQTNTNKYLVTLVNLGMELPLEVTTSNGTEKVMIDRRGKTITSETPPVIDAKGYYLKRVVME